VPNYFKRRKRYRSLSNQYLKGEIDPDEILIDAKNLPEYDIERLEGKLERPISKRTLLFIGMFFSLVLLVYAGKAFALQVKDGTYYVAKSENNRLKETSIIADRGVITDRNGKLLAWNVPNDGGDFALRKYIEQSGFGILLGYLSYPQKDASGNYFQNHFIGKDGLEETFNDKLAGVNGLKITETDARGKIESESTLEPPQNGEPLKLSIDARVQAEMYKDIQQLADKVNFVGGSGVIMDIKTGELIALTSYPEFESQVLTDGKDKAAIAGYATNPRNPYLDRPISGLYSPGSIVKPIVAIGALTEKVIDPNKQILSTGSISIPNPYDPSKPSIFKDWRAQGYVDMRHAIAVSSDVYFYEVGGGFQDQKGLGISNIEKYFRLFGLGSETGIDLGSEEIGTIPNPAWKAENFDGDPWRVGDTYHTAIGQYGVQVTPIQMVRAIASIANNGTLISPTILERDTPATGTKLPIDPNNFQIVREGMRLGAQIGTAAALNIPEVEVAGKTGTAQLGVSKSTVNSWVTGFFPYQNPRYAFLVQMEKGPAGNLYGASLVMYEMLKWMAQNTPEYLTVNPK
jgi:penicillin-binding protein 2